MANELYIYGRPTEALVTLTLDSGQVITGPSCVANGRDDAHLLQLPPGTTGQGGLITITCAGRQTKTFRGLVCPSDSNGPATFLFDDFGELEAETPAPEPPDPPPDPHADPSAIIDAVYALQDHDLTTKGGCGTFTEDCCIALHEQQSAEWGHIRKTGAQNQFNEHAVDALYLRTAAGTTKAGVYDIIHDSESPNASPACNWKDAGDPSLWYYPA